ncbi:hypothetical protein [Arcobacter arenosus]|uniref:hypothetical protein n=1 Tax=Arcobacter arenosus TaxID=2576037 RepID=UPI00148521A9|nr:hypothetical protein [Arcobacter arenosus]
MKSYITWSNYDTQTLINMRKAGCTFKDIQSELEDYRELKAIRVKAIRLGLTK